MIILFPIEYIMEYIVFTFHISIYRTCRLKHDERVGLPSLRNFLSKGIFINVWFQNNEHKIIYNESIHIVSFKLINFIKRAVWFVMCFNGLIDCSDLWCVWQYFNILCLHNNYYLIWFPNISTIYCMKNSNKFEYKQRTFHIEIYLIINSKYQSL